MPRESKMHHVWQLTCLVGLVLCAGCNTRPEAARLQGELSYDGRPIEKGKIDFVPVDGTVGGAASAVIVNGRYEFPPKAGVLPTGVYAVRIVALRKTGKTEPNRVDRGSPPIEVEENFIPPTYNTESTLKVRVSELPDRNKVDFHIGPKPGASPH
jgi:hypothetical protein